MSELNKFLYCKCEIQYTLEKHGDGYALYLGRCRHKHGLNIALITEVDPKFNIQNISEALNKFKQKGGE